MRGAVRARHSRAVQHESNARAVEGDVHEKLVEAAVQEGRVERHDGVCSLVGHAGGGGDSLGLGDTDVDHTTRVGLVHGAKAHGTHHRGRNADDVIT